MKIQLILVLFILFSATESSVTLNSTGIWNKVVESIDNRKMNFNKCYFIFDPNNYAKLDKDNTTMSNFTLKQKKIYNKYGIKNYFFIVDDFDIERENIETVAKNLQLFISKDYGINMSNSIIIFIGIKSRKIRVQIGKSLNNYINDHDAQAIINSMASYMRNEQYYYALNKVLYSIEYYYNRSINNYNNINY